MWNSGWVRVVWGEQKVREGVPSVLESQDFHIIHLETIAYINCMDSTNTGIASR